MARNSQGTLDELAFQLVSLPIGASGMDARRNDAATLVDLVNARFADQMTAERRGGHSGQLLQGSGSFDPTDTVTSKWVYGNGLVAETADGAEARVDSHYPIAGKGKGGFNHNGTEVAWTGDRLIAAGKEQRAYLPVLVDTPFEFVGGSHVDVCPFDLGKAMAVAVEAGGLVAVVLDNDGLLTHRQDLGSGEVIRLRIVKAGEELVLLFIDDDGFKVSRWNGSAWATPSVVESSSTVFDVTTDDTGCFFAWNEIDGATHVLKAGDIHDGVVGGYFTFGSTLDLSGYTLNDYLKFGMAVSVNGRLAYAFTSEGRDIPDVTDMPAGLYCSACDTDLTSAMEPVQLSTNSQYQTDGGHATVAWRQLSYGAGMEDYKFAVYANPTEQFVATAADSTNIVNGWIVGTSIEETLTIYNARLLSTAFNVGNETFVWMKSLLSTTAFLVGGVGTPQRCAMADREEALFVEVGSPLPKTALRHVQKTGEYTYLWARPFNTGGYFRRGDIRVGALDFMPAMSTARFAGATYVMGSLVRAWDGYELGDAGFHDYPLATALGEVANPSTGMPIGTYQFRIYPVRYTAAGERMKGVGAVSETITTVALADIDVEVATMPLTNHSDVKLEVYMAYTGRTEFRLVDTLDNDLTVGHIQTNVSMSLNTWLTKPADEHAPTTGTAAVLESFGPLGCSVLCTSGDRLWGAGGQVPPGLVQYSKRYEVNQAAGFSDISSTQVLDATGAAITSLASFSDSALVGFKEKGFYTILGDGPDNYGNGSYDPPNLTVASGAVNHSGTKATPSGVFYWAPEGPRVLTAMNRSEFVGEPVRPLAKDMTPTGVRVELDKGEVIWYTDNGAALLLNFAGQAPRWARWDGVPVVGVSETSLITPNGELWTPSEDELDAGRSFSFSFETGNIRLDRALQGGQRVQQIGLTGKWLGEHRVRVNVFYDGAPDWLERIFWTPSESSCLIDQADIEALTPAEIDALNIVDFTGRYDLMARVSRQDCAFVRLLISDLGSRGFLPQAVTLKIAPKGDRTRIAAQRLNRNGE